MTDEKRAVAEITRAMTLISECLHINNITTPTGLTALLALAAQVLVKRGGAEDADIRGICEVLSELWLKYKKIEGQIK